MMDIGSIIVDGITLSFQRQGACTATDPTIVLLHGNSGCKEVFQHQFTHFENTRFSVLAIDLPGHGASDNALTPETTYTMPGYARMIDKALTTLGVEHYILVGWSLGGNIGLEMAGCDMGMKGLMIFGAPPVGPGMKNVEKAYLPATFASAIGDDDTPSDQIDAFVDAIYGTLAPVPKPFYTCAHRTEGRAREIMVSHWLGGQNGHVQYETVANWEKPICVAHGNLDPFAALEYLQLAPWKNLWHDKVIEFPACGHAPFVEDPAGFNAVLEQFASDVLT
ncbi:MAG: epoxide hydrolase [Robiginitomaculum sp.]|nr:MAG: epoxide hydrolase [Robiginitomaculum sp.]